MDLRWYQSEACEAVWNCFRNNQGNPLIELPTGAGKSLCIAELCRAAVEDHAGQVIVLAHRKELLEQNYSKIVSLLPPNVKAGLFSAGLRRYSQEEPIIVAGIQSCYEKASWFGRRHLVIVDEAHLVPSDGNGMYQTFLTDLQRYNDRLRIVGLTATPFRTGEGALWGDDCLFTHVCYSAGLRRLIDEEFLCPITSKPTKNEYDTSGLKVKRGEFVERDLVSLFGDQAKVVCSTKEIVEKTAGRRSILVFTTGVAHAELVQKSIEELTGERVGIVTGETMALERAFLLKQFASQELRWLVNIDVLTTGFDAPCIDALAILRATASPGLFAQICGRGLRKHHAKTDCLVLDFGENIKRHGPLDDLNFGKQKKRGSTEFEGETPMKECPNCKSAVPVSRKECDCGWMFPGREINHEEIADTESKILSEPEAFEVVQVAWGRHSKREGTDSLRVDYRCQRDEGNIEERISEWICIEHEGFARRKAEQWWKAHCLSLCPNTIDEAIEYFERSAVALPSAIVARKEGKFWRVTHQTLGTLPPKQDWVELESLKVLQEEEMPF
jgi:DNA repair protein RadD